jgi:hypothetical protein
MGALLSSRRSFERPSLNRCIAATLLFSDGKGRANSCPLPKIPLSRPHATGLRESVDNREAGEHPALFPQL